MKGWGRGGGWRIGQCHRLNMELHLQSLNIWWPMPLFLDIYFINRYRYNMEEKIDTYTISVGVCLWFCRLDVVLKLGCIGAGLM
jgi:hypothetical protein